MATKKTTGPTTIGKDLIREGTGVITAAELQAAAAKKAPAKKATPKKRTPRKTTTVPDPVEPWDQRKDETGPAYEAFLAYRDLGLTRSLSKVGRQLGKSTTLMDRWSASHSWVARAIAYDKALDREWVLEAKERRRKAARRNADMADEALNLVAKRIKQLGKIIDVDADTYDPEAPQLDILDIRRLVDSLGRIERLALGESTENVQVTGKDGGPLKVDYSKLTDEERLERLKHLRDEMDKRLAAAGVEDVAS